MINCVEAEGAERSQRRRKREREIAMFALEYLIVPETNRVEQCREYSVCIKIIEITCVPLFLLPSARVECRGRIRKWIIEGKMKTAR